MLKLKTKISFLRHTQQAQNVKYQLAETAILNMKIY